MRSIVLQASTLRLVKLPARPARQDAMLILHAAQPVQRAQLGHSAVIQQSAQLPVQLGDSPWLVLYHALPVPQDSTSPIQVKATASLVRRATSVCHPTALLLSPV